MTEFAVCIPRVSVAISEAEVTELLVGEGEVVQEGDPLYVIATDKVESEIPAGASGTVHWSCEVDTVYDLGTRIGTIRTAD